MLSRGELKQFIEQLKQLPTLSPVAIKLFEVAGRKDCSLAEVSRIIESDQAICSRILKIANSAHTGMPRQIDTVQRATSLLGLDMVRSIALSVIVFELFRDLEDQPLSLVNFWRHSCCCAILCELIAEKMGYPKPKQAFVSGLLHDLGKLLLLHFNSEEYQSTVSQAKASRSRLLEYEERDFGIGHCQAAKMLMDYWHFPDGLVSGVWLHHQPISRFNGAEQADLPLIVKCANSLCHINRIGDSGNPVVDLDRETIESTLGMTSTEVRKMVEKALERFDRISELFEFNDSTHQMYVSAVSQSNQELARMQMDLIMTNQRLSRRQVMLEAISRLHEEAHVQISAPHALEKAVEVLSDAMPFNRIMGFLVLEREGVIEGRVRMGPKSEIRRVVLPLEAEEMQEITQLQPRQQFTLIEQAVLRLGDGLAVGADIVDSLRGANLVVFPLEAEGVTLGQLLIELDPRHRSQDAVELLKQYARAALLALERVLLFEAVENQADQLARMARKAEKTQLQLYQAERLASVGRLAAGAAHEINNPLAAISAQAQLMLRKTEDEKNIKSLNTIVEQSARISKIIRDLMGFARPAEPRIEPTMIKQVVEQALGILESRIKVAGVQVVKDFESDLPILQADSKQLEQVFLNLFVNAIHAMPEGGTLKVRVRQQKRKSKLLIEVIDTGKGIAPENLPMIFDPFFTTKGEGEGTGLGLAVCHSIIESHGGEVTVESKVGQGTRFSVLLPMENTSRIKQIKSDLSKKPRTASPSKARTGSVLVVDDEDSLRKVLQEALSQEGYHVDTAMDGVEGLALTNQQTYDVVILDLRMPRKEGMEVLAEMRKSAPETPVIVISGLAHEREFSAAQKAGAYACFKKPFDIGEVLEAVSRAIRKKRSAVSNSIA